MFNRIFKIAIVAACAALTIPAVAQAQWWQHHPKYLHAMSNLRTAYWLIAHHESRDPAMRPEESAAMNLIGRAYQDLKNASIMDNKDIYDQPPANMNFYDHRGRLHRVVDLLREARNDIQGEEEDPAARGLRHRATLDIDQALHATNVTIQAFMF